MINYYQVLCKDRTFTRLEQFKSQDDKNYKLVKKVEHYFLNDEKDNVEHIFTVTGFSFAGRGQNSAIGFADLKDWDVRGGEGQDVASIAGRAMGSLSQIKDAMVFAFFPPAVIELCNASGFDFQLLD